MVDHHLLTYLQHHIIPIYQNFDLAHKPDHVFDVINNAFEIAKDYDVDANMLYTIAVFHDLGLIEDRKTHHIVGGRLLESDIFIQKFFTKEKITIMKEAVEDHRASSKNPPRSIYGKIIAEADRTDDMQGTLKRCVLFAVHKQGASSFNEVYDYVLEHVIEKYGENGYLKVWLETKHVSKMLLDIRTLLKDQNAFKSYIKELYKAVKDNFYTTDI